MSSFPEDYLILPMRDHQGDWENSGLSGWAGKMVVVVRWDGVVVGWGWSCGDMTVVRVVVWRLARWW